MLPSKTRWFKIIQSFKDDWIIAGKGPSFSPEAVQQFASSFGLNDVVREQYVDIAHAIDMEVIARNCKYYYENCGYLLMPTVVNTNYKAARLENFVNATPVLRALKEQNRLITYSRTSKPVDPSGTCIHVKYFSVEAAFQILARTGVTKITTTGIDGGTDYSPHFADLIPLENGRSTFNAQTKQIKSTCAVFGVDWCKSTA